MDNHSHRSALRFEPSHALHVVMVFVMIAAVSWSISSFISPWVAAAVGTVLTYVFADRAKVAFGIYPNRSPRERVVAGLTAWFLFALTMGCTYSSLYERVFARTSAERHLQEVRAPIQRQLSMVLADSVAARNAFDAWARDSRMKSDQEGRKGDGGGTCPAKPQTGGKRGPIAMWRDAEASMANKLDKDFNAAIRALEQSLGDVPVARPDTYDAALDTMARLNAAISVGESVTHGTVIQAALDTLDRQLNSTITWTDGSVFDCGDTARVDLMLTAQKSLKGLQGQPVVKALEPAIDLKNRQEVATRGLLRSFNAAAKLATFGFVGSFADDELWQAANAQSGSVIHRESLGLGLAALLEICVLLTAAIAGRKGASPIPVDLMQGFRDWEARAQASQGRMAVLHGVTLPVAKTAVNFLFRDDQQQEAGNPVARNGSGPVRPALFKKSRHAVVEFEADPDVPSRELGWASELLPWLFAWNDKEYVIVPQDRAPRASVAVRALDYANAASIVGTEVPWEVVARHRAAARRLTRLLLDARTSTFEVYELAPSVAQALRMNLLKISA